MTTDQGNTQQESVPTNSMELDDAEKLFAEVYKSSANASAAPTAVVENTEAQTAAQTTTETKPEVETKPVVQETVENKTVEQNKESQTTAADTTKSNTDQKEIADPYAWVKDLPADIQEKVQKEIQGRQYQEQRYRSDIGRISAYQKQTFDLQKQIAELRSKQPPAQQAATATKPADEKALADWNTLIDADPSLAKAVDARIAAEVAAMRQEFGQRLEAKVDPLYQHTESTYQDQQLELLQQKVPNYRSVLESPEYQYWISSYASPALRNTAATSQNHEDAISVLRAYSMDAEAVHNELVRMGRVRDTTVNKQEQQKETKVEATSTDTARADKVAHARAQKVQTAAKIQEAPSPIAAQPSGLSGRIGDQIDLEDPTVLAAFEAEFKKNSRR